MQIVRSELLNFSLISTDPAYDSNVFDVSAVYTKGVDWQTG